MSLSTGTYGWLKYKIADELGDRQDLLAYLSDSQQTGATGSSGGTIQDAIQQAIAKWERQRFYFNELLMEYNTTTWSTANGQEYYGDTSSPSAWTSPKLSQVANISKMWVYINANRYAINPRTFNYMADTSVNPQVYGYPVDFAYTANMGRFYPIPDGTYPVGMVGTERLSTLSADGDSNSWTQDAFDLIRCEAKLIIAESYLHDAALAAECKLAIYGDPQNMKVQGFLDALKGESNRRKGYSRIRPTYF